MRRAWFSLALLAGLRPATVDADSFAEVAGGIMTPGGRPPGVALADPGPRRGGRAGTMDRPWADHVVSVDWTPIATDAADTSAHRIRATGSFAFNARVGALNLSARTGIGLDFLRVRRSAESKTLVGYALDLGAGLWFAAGPVELGGDIAIPLGLNGGATVGDLELEAYVSTDLDLLLGVRHVWR